MFKFVDLPEVSNKQAVNDTFYMKHHLFIAFTWKLYYNSMIPLTLNICDKKTFAT